jgi:hypothetical protein
MIARETVPLSQHDLLTEDECAVIAKRVVELRPQWTQRSPGFYSLGAASYIDAASRADGYLGAAQRINAVLLQSFSGLYDDLAGFLEALLEESVRLDTSRAAPGFHVFEYNGANRGHDDEAPRAHFDLQWKNAYPDKTPTGTLSFTLLIEAPSGGSSMAVWNLRYQDALLGVTSRDHAMHHRPQHVAYAPGRLVIHDGLILHAIGAAGMRNPLGRRITLQGHGIRLDRNWLLYW